jgi:hypothetical protein
MTLPTQLATPSTLPYSLTASASTASTAWGSRGSAAASDTSPAAPDAAAAALPAAACTVSSLAASRPDSSSCAPGCAASSSLRQLPMPPVAPNTTYTARKVGGQGRMVANGDGGKQPAAQPTAA